jgi:single-strand DNA-binding protein
MNNVQLIGNLTKDIELRKTQNGKSVVNFTLAVARTFNREETDFIQCQAWGKTADILHQYCHKGSKIGLNGSIETGSYEKNGQRVYTTTVIANSIELLTPREPMTAQNTQSSTNMYGEQQEPYMKPKYDYGQSLTEMAETDGITSDDLPF